MSSDEYRVAVVGPPETGKTCLVQTFIRNLWTDSDELAPGETFQLWEKVFASPTSSECLLNFNEVNCLEEDALNAVTDSSDGFVLVFDRDLKNFETLRDSWEKIVERRGGKVPPSVMVATMRDLEMDFTPEEAAELDHAYEAMKVHPLHKVSISAHVDKPTEVEKPFAMLLDDMVRERHGEKENESES